MDKQKLYGLIVCMLGYLDLSKGSDFGRYRDEVINNYIDTIYERIIIGDTEYFRSNSYTELQNNTIKKLKNCLNHMLYPISENDINKYLKCCDNFDVNILNKYS